MMGSFYIFCLLTLSLTSLKFRERLYDYFFDLFPGRLFTLISLVPFQRFCPIFPFGRYSFVILSIIIKEFLCHHIISVFVSMY